MSEPDFVSYPDVEVLTATTTALVVRIRGRRVSVPYGDLAPGTTIQRDGDRGTLVVARWLAETLGLT